MGRTAERHVREFVAFLTDLVAHHNLSAHKTTRVEAFLQDHPTVRLHFTPTYSSWLNQVELWFAKIERDLIARDIFTSQHDLKRKIMRDNAVRAVSTYCRMGRKGCVAGTRSSGER